MASDSLLTALNRIASACHPFISPFTTSKFVLSLRSSNDSSRGAVFSSTSSTCGLALGEQKGEIGGSKPDFVSRRESDFLASVATSRKFCWRVVRRNALSFSRSPRRDSSCSRCARSDERWHCPPCLRNRKQATLIFELLAPLLRPYHLLSEIAPQVISDEFSVHASIALSTVDFDRLLVVFLSIKVLPHSVHKYGKVMEDITVLVSLSNRVPFLFIQHDLHDNRLPTSNLGSKHRSYSLHVKMEGSEREGEEGEKKWMESRPTAV